MNPDAIIYLWLAVGLAAMEFINRLTLDKVISWIS